MLRMGESIKQMLQGPCLMMMEPNSKSLDDHWVNMEDDEDHTDNNALSSSTTSSSLENSATSNETSSSSEHSSSTSYSSSHSSGPLYELSELMAQLPIKRGLSKYFQGKSQSFTSLSRVESVEDLAKKETPPYRRKKKASKRYGGGLDAHKAYTLPKATISKKTFSRGVVLFHLSPIPIED